MSGATASRRCSLARVHVPGQPAPDQHHVIPQAWQRFWAPTNDFTPLVIGSLWDRRTITVCPNHHRLVHEAIVAMMRAGQGFDSPATAYRAAFGSMRRTAVRGAAYLALTRWVAAGGSLEALRQAGQWGEQ